MKFVVPEILTPKTLDKRVEPAVGDDKEMNKSLGKLREALSALQAAVKPAEDEVDTGFKATTAANAAEKLLELKKAKVTKEFGDQLVEKLKAVKEHADDLREVLAKPAGSDKTRADAVKALQAMVVDGRTWCRDVGRGVAQFIDKIEKEQKRLEEQQSGAKGGGSTEAAKMTARTKTALLQISGSGGDITHPFVIADCKTDMFVYVARDANPSYESKVKEALGEAGSNATIIRGTCGFQDRRVLFVGAKLSGGTYAPRIQKYLLAAIGRRLPIAVGTDKTALEVLDSDDFDDPLDYLIAQNGPLAGRAKSCKALRASVIKDLDKLGIMDLQGLLTRKAEDLLERAAGAAERHELADFERVMRSLREDVVAEHIAMQRQVAEERKKFDTKFNEFKPKLEKARAAIARRLEDVEQALKDKVVKQEDVDAAEKRRRDMKERTALFDKAVAATKDAKGWADGSFAEARVAMLELEDYVDGVAKNLEETKGDIDAARKKKDKQEKADREKAEKADKDEKD